MLELRAMKCFRLREIGHAFAQQIQFAFTFGDDLLTAIEFLQPPVRCGTQLLELKGQVGALIVHRNPSSASPQLPASRPTTEHRVAPCARHSVSRK